jgi:hypothetical protein
MKVNVDLNSVIKQLKSNQNLAKDLIDSAGDFFIKQTPIRSGNARRNTDVQQSRKRIVADYPYSEALDTGWSRQAPDGMVKPTIDFIEKEVQKKIKE